MPRRPIRAFAGAAFGIAVFALTLVYWRELGAYMLHWLR
jgi:hypothetical protein